MDRVCLIRLKPYPQDTRFVKEVEALLEAGYEVDVICGGRPGEPARERRGRLSVRRVRIDQRRGGPLRYLLRYAAFTAAATALAGAAHLRRRYRVVEVSSLPDALVFAAIVPRLLGARVLLHLLECTPEFVAMKYRLGARHPLVRAAAVVERASIAFAHRVVTCTEQMRARFVERGAPPDKIAVILLSADEALFDPRRAPAARDDDGTFVLAYHGTLEESLGADTVVRAVGLLRDELPGLRLRIFGDGTLRPVLERRVRDLRLEGLVTISGGFVPLPELVAGLASADAGVVPTKRNPMRELTHSNKMFDYIALGKPAIVGRTAAVEAYFDETSLQLFESGDAHDLARAIRELHADPDLRRRLVERATAVSEPYRWVHQRARYLAIVRDLATEARGSGMGRVQPEEG